VPKFHKGNPLFLELLSHRESRKALEGHVKGMSPAAAALTRSGKGGDARRRAGQAGEN
jgi:hypothetical protein